MITEFKIFENKEIVQYWKIHNDKDVKISLFKLGMPFNEIDTFSSTMLSNPKAVKANILSIISRDGYKGDKLSYSWDNIFYDDVAAKYNYTYRGEILINQEDRDKYDMKIQAIKYNL